MHHAPADPADSRSTGSQPQPSRAVVIAGPADVRYGLAAEPRALRAIPWQAPAGAWERNTLHLDQELLPTLQGGMPLFAAVHGPEGWRPYTQTAFTPKRSLLLALDGPPLVPGHPDDPQTLQQWATDLTCRHRQAGPQATNHQRWFINARPDEEIEHKFTLTGGRCNTLELALGVLHELQTGQIPGWVPEYGNNDGFEEWNFLNHLVAFDAPDGHIAFIPAVNGTWIVREKWGPPAGRRIRPEKLTSGVVLGPDPDLESEAWRMYQVKPAWRGGYRRIRYNVMLESPRTGHIFSIMFDHCVDLDGNRPDLRQVEVEYVRSRTLRSNPTQALMEQFDELTVWTRNYLRNRVNAVEDQLAKIGWLRPAAAANRPP